MRIAALVPLIIAVGVHVSQTVDPGRASTSHAADHGGQLVTAERNVSGASGPGSIRFRPGRSLTATNVTLQELIAYVFQRHAFDQREIVGGPKWASTERFDLVIPVAQGHAISPDGALHGVWSDVRRALADRL